MTDLGFSHAEEQAEAQRLLASRLDDWIARSDGGEIAVTPFLSPKEQHFVLQCLRRKGREGTVRFRGGYASAERRRAYLLPEYLRELLLDAEEGSELETLYFGDTLRETIALLEVRGGGYVPLSHRDFLGAVLGLGLERAVIGDILVLPYEEVGREQRRAYLFCDEKIAPFLTVELRKIGKETVHLLRGELPEGFVPEKKVRPIGDTVASNRLDCVIGSLVNASRDKAQSIIRSGLVEIDYEPEQRVDRRLDPPQMISVRGYGKFQLLSLGDVTRKGRLRLRAEQYL